jgi:hypothetical protein
MTQYGPSVSSSYPLGRYLEDNDFLGDRPGYTNGVQFDLDEFNGRWCVTPEFPNGTYAYFTCISSNGTELFPDNIGRQFYGTVTTAGPNASGVVAAISESVTTNFVGGPNAELRLAKPVANKNLLTLTWSAIEGGSYRVEATGDFLTWTTNATGIAPTLNRGTASTTMTTNQLFRVIRSGLSAYDATGF